MEVCYGRISNDRYCGTCGYRNRRNVGVNMCEVPNSMNKIEEIVIALQQYVNVTNDEQQLKVPQIL